MHDVFISYAHEERPLARKLAQALLAARGWLVWWDTSLRTGEQFPKRIQDAVAASRCVVVLWSKHSIDSNWVVAEASEGWERQVLAPVLLDASEPPMPFRQTQARDLSQWRGAANDASLLALIEDIQRIHAQGAVIDTAELAEREQRRRAFKRRQVLRRAAIVAAVLLVLAGAVMFWRQFDEQRGLAVQADELARESETLRAEVLALTPEQDQKIWWTNLYEDVVRADKLQLSLLLAVEAQRISPTERVQRALREALVILPGADEELEIESSESPLQLEFNADGHLLAAGGGVGDTLVWDLERDAVVTRIPHGGAGGANPWNDKRGRFHDGRFCRQAIDFDPARDVIATAGPDTTARTWEARTGNELLRLSLAELATAVAFDGQGKRLATSDESGAVCIWDAVSGRKQHCMKQGSPVYWVGFSPSSALLAGVDAEGSIEVWDVASGERRHRLVHDKNVEAARFHPNDTLLATFGSDTPTQVWDLETGKPWRLGPDDSSYAGVAFDAAKNTMIVPRGDGTIVWWDLGTHKERLSVSAGTFILAMAVSPERRHLVTIDDFREARAWHLDDGRLLKRVPYYKVRALAISPDGESFAVAGEQGYSAVIEVTRIVPQDPVAAACERLTRNLTREEWQRYRGDEPYRATCPNVESDAVQ
jgi:WD40 repeat protein